MNDDGLKTTILGFVLTTLAGAVGWLIRRVLGNREEIVQLKAEVARLKESQISVECVREVIEDALSKRDAVAIERRAQWDERLTLKIQQAVSQGVQECQDRTKAELERMVPRIVRETLHQTRRMET